MTEEEQLRAMAAEYEAAGYRVDTNVAGDEAGIKIPATMRLDLVAQRRDVSTVKEMPRLIVVEVANRSRRGRSGKVSEDAEKESVRRFETISNALAGFEDHAARLEIRFFDLSAEQARSRTVKSVKPKSNDDLKEELAKTRAELNKRFSSESLRGLVIARHWTRWLRLMAYRFPGSGGELKLADLRVIEKDLYDGGILKLAPSSYRRSHANLVAIFEGGDVDWAAVNGLRAPLGDLLRYVEERTSGKKQPERNLSATSLREEVEPPIIDKGRRIPRE